MSFDPKKYDKEALAHIASRMEQGTPQTTALGVRLISAGPEGASMAVPWKPEFVGEPETGVMAGGVVTTLLDHVCGLAVSCAVITTGGAITQYGMATLDLRIDYMRPAEKGRDVIARAFCYKITRSIAFVRASAFEDDETNPIATAQAAFAFTGPRAATPAGGGR
jgi:uncharacterized protein (TIGR00369 family)